MDNNKLRVVVTVGALVIGCLMVILWLFLPLPFSPRNQAPITNQEYFLLKVETEIDNMRMLLALKTNLGFIEAQDPAERVRDLCFEYDKKAWPKWNAIVTDMNVGYKSLVVDQTATLDQVLSELYAKHPFLKLEGVEGQIKP